MRVRKPYRVKRKKSVFKNRFFWLMFFVLLFSGAIVYGITFASLVQIKKIHIYGAESIKREEIEDLVWEGVDQKILLFPTKSIFFTNNQKIEENLSKKFPKISQVNLKRQIPDSVVIEMKERKPLYVFCKDSGPCFYLDERGVIFEEIFPDAISLLRIKDMRNLEVKLGSKVAEDQLLNGIKTIESKLKEKTELSPQEIILFEEKMEVQTSQNFLIYFNPKEDIEKQVQKLILTFENEIPQEKRENLDYIDLRFGDKVYYKYK